jgi:methylated-DNA-[protein]-cysteine S-methyltransferase
MKPAVHFTTHASPLGDLTLAATEEGLCGLCFKGHKPAPERAGWKRGDNAHLDAARAWLGAYFAGEKPRKLPQLTFVGGTPFQRRVWDALRDIPRGQTTTYAALASAIGSPRAARAIGAAVGRNPISILIPCHRVIGRDGTLTGYAGGLTRKKQLLALEGVNIA